MNEIEELMTEWLKDPNNKHLGARKSAIKFAEYYHKKTMKMDQEIKYLAEKAEALDNRITLALDDGYTEVELKALIHEHVMIKNILNNIR